MGDHTPPPPAWVPPPPVVRPPVPQGLATAGLVRVVPIVNLWFPYPVVRDVVRNAWRDPWGDQWQGLHLGVWWSAWVVSIVTSQVASRAIPWSGTPDADAVALLPLLHLVTAVATVVGFALWVRIVRSVVRGLQSA